MAEGEGEAVDVVVRATGGLDASDVPAAILSIEAANLPSRLEDAMGRLGYHELTPIQAQAWPIVFTGHDLVGIADTGTGKTLSFVVPALCHIINEKGGIDSSTKARKGAPRVVVLAPTRELAQQIYAVAVPLSQAANVKTSCLYGGDLKYLQVRELDAGVDLVVATLGRLADLAQGSSLSVDTVTMLVIDEADRMLDMGFSDRMLEVMGPASQKRQTLLFSATWPPEVQFMALQFVRRAHVHIQLGSTETTANRSIDQTVYIVDDGDKPAQLVKLLEEVMLEDDNKTLVFVHTKAGTETLTRALRTESWPAKCIHGDKEQTERDWVLQDFRRGATPILVATDVASRGLDVKDVRNVINYDFPSTIEAYVHRIGRTGRAGQRGRAFSFFCQKDTRLAKRLVAVLTEAEQPVPPQLHHMAFPPS
eukprot:m.448515 g.448515  ORF g.448515 m.448515 type:complete len:422 (-) comp20315_c14_seq41:6938-8203(-)